MPKKTSPKDGSRDHHHVPQFHLGKWVGPDEKLIQWGRVPGLGKLVRKPVAPAQTGYLPNLYAQQLVDPADVHKVEDEVFGVLETKAAPVLDRLQAGQLKELSPDEFLVWAQYVNALAFRTPEALDLARSKAPDILQAELGRAIPEFDALKGDAPEKTLLEWTQNRRPESLANFALGAIVKNVEEGKSIDRILSFRWVVINFTRTTNRDLLLSDRPLIRVGDLHKPGALLALPITPKMLFVAADTFETAKKLLAVQPAILVRLTNITSMMAARRFVYGFSEARFIEKHLLVDERAILSKS
jgi:Protein of unknown function (DUF4238)